MIKKTSEITVEVSIDVIRDLLEWRRLYLENVFVKCAEYSYKDVNNNKAYRYTFTITSDEVHTLFTLTWGDYIV